MSPGRTIHEERELTAFLIERQTQGDSSWVGMSSDSMLAVALGVEEFPEWLPADSGDLKRCEETYRRAPAFLKGRMLWVLELGRRAVAEGGLYCRGCDTFGHRATIHYRCETCDPEAFENSRRRLIRGRAA